MKYLNFSAGGVCKQELGVGQINFLKNLHCNQWTLETSGRTNHFLKFQIRLLYPVLGTLAPASLLLVQHYVYNRTRSSFYRDRPIVTRTFHYVTEHFQLHNQPDRRTRASTFPLGHKSHSFGASLVEVVMVVTDSVIVLDVNNVETL